ncbi:hypothetical protein V5N11_007211 [Cardamine amara subsp. amara]|uniref:Uncharacterized protein n=1 Tax=Cardamine amara subsp. amara TaxID=228776 RepID=A0ABD0ZZK1_CARAN
MFDKRWTSKSEVEEVIRESWCRGDRDVGYPLFERIADCQRALSKWKRKSNTNSNTLIKGLRERLENEGNKLISDMRLMQLLKLELADAYRSEEVYWKQKTRENWLKDGDRNTKFFHGSVKRRRAQNTIPILINEEGVEQVAEGSKGEIAVEYFRNLFTSTKPAPALDLLDGMLPRVTSEMNDALIKQVTDGEIRQAAGV